MPRTNKSKTPGAVLQSLIEEYQINPFYLSKSIRVAYQSVTNILNGKGRITVHMALRLGQFFGNSPKYWLDIQSSSEIDELSADKKFISIIKSIPNVKDTAGKPKKEKNTRSGKKKTGKVTGIRKKATKPNKTKKAYNARKAKGKRAGKPRKK